MSEVSERFERVRRDAPDRPLIFRAATGQVITADALASLARSVEEVLVQAGTAPGQPVMSVAGNTPTAVGLLLACRHLGIPLLPVDKGASAVEIASLAARFGARLVVANAASVASPRRVALPDGLNLFVLEEQPPADAPWTDTAVMKLTSGSTGLPRATMTTDANLVADAEAITESMAIGPADRQLAAIPLSHAYGLGNLVMPLLIQGTAIVLRDGFVPHQLTQDAQRFGITMFPGVPFMFEHLLQHMPEDAWPSSLARLMSAGARLEADTVSRFHQKFGIKIHSFYGTSEAGGICFDDSPDVDEDPTVGRPLPRVTVALKPADGAPPDGGRVHVAGPAVAPGYASAIDDGADDEEASFVDGGFLTGDLGRFDARHHLELHGRVSSFVNVAGRKVQPLEIEAVLRDAPGVSDVRVLGAPDALRGQQLVACVVMEGGAHDTGAGLRAHCAARLAPFKIPRRFLFLDGIPLTERGKTDRTRLEALVTEHLSATR